MTIGPLPRMTPVKLGPLEVHAAVDGVASARLITEMMLGGTDELVEANIDWLEPGYVDSDSQKLVLAYQSFIVKTPEATILVDCAVGEDGEYVLRPDWHHAKSNWMNHLGQAGVAPEDIDIVFLTHLHVDHTGWLTRKTADGWAPSFPRARHLTTKIEFDYWTKHHAQFQFMERSIPDSVAPVAAANLFSFVSPGDEIAEALFVVDLAGHSPGMTGLEYRTDGKVIAAFNADLMHHPLQMMVPEMSTRFCSDPDQTARVRRDKLEEYCRNETIMFCGHFPGQSAGRAVALGQGYRFAQFG